MTRRLSPTRVVVGLVLGTWAVVSWYLSLTGKTGMYLSPRTEWVVPIGASILTVAAIGRLLTARTTDPERLTRRDAIGFAVVLLPALAVVVAPPGALGAYAASRESLSTGYVASSPELSSGPITLTAVAAAKWSKDASKALAKRAGEDVTFDGFVDLRSGMPADEFFLTRFIVSCCAADALAVQVRVIGVPPGKFKEDQWVRASGGIYPLGQQDVVLDASEVISIPEPDDPYLTP